jgi:DNA-binding CsgD family transcriptional regulator
MAGRGILDGIGAHGERLLDRLAAQRQRRLPDALSAIAVAGALPFVELRLAELGHGVHLLGFLTVTVAAALRLGPGMGAIVLAAGSVGCVMTAMLSPDAADVPGLVARVALYLLVGAAFLVVVQGSIRLRRRHVALAPVVLLAGGPVEQLTAREVGILRLAASGMDVAEMADLLFLSPNTVKTHLAHAYQKLGARNRQDAIRAAIHCGCLHFSDVCPHRSPVAPASHAIE